MKSGSFILERTPLSGLTDMDLYTLLNARFLHYQLGILYGTFLILNGKRAYAEQQSQRVNKTDNIKNPAQASPYAIKFMEWKRHLLLLFFRKKVIL